jgi:hypothetical protein
MIEHMPLISCKAEFRDQGRDKDKELTILCFFTFSILSLYQEFSSHLLSSIMPSVMSAGTLPEVDDEICAQSY